MNPNLAELLEHTDAVMSGRATGCSVDPAPMAAPGSYRGPLHVGVDLGTAYTVLMVLDQEYRPIAGVYEFAQVVRDGLVVDYLGAVALLRRLKQRVERKLGFELTSAASTYPPGVSQADVRATAHVLEAAGLECTGLVDEPTAANNVLKLDDGAIADVGGGTTGVAIVRGGRVVCTADEPTGGTQFSLVIAGAERISFEEAEELKKDPREQARLFAVIRPVMEKVGSIVLRHLAGHQVETLYLVGGTSAYPGMAKVIEDYTGVTTVVPPHPLFVTPLGTAMHN